MKRIRVGIARLLTRGTDCTVVRKSVVNDVQRIAGELHEYVNRSGGLQSNNWIHAWREIFVETKKILDQLINIEVSP